MINLRSAPLWINVRPPGVDTHAIGVFLRLPGLGHAIAGDRDDLKVDPITVSEPILVVGWKIPIDTPTDVDAFRPDPDLLDDSHAAVDVDPDITLVRQYALIAQRRPDHEEISDHEDETGQVPDTHGPHTLISTRGVARACSPSGSKNSAGTNLNGRATSTSGTVSTLVL